MEISFINNQKSKTFKWGGHSESFLVLENKFLSQSITSKIFFYNINVGLQDSSFALSDTTYNIVVSDQPIDINHDFLFTGKPILSGTEADNLFFEEIDSEFEREYTLSTDNNKVYCVLTNAPHSIDCYIYLTQSYL